MGFLFGTEDPWQYTELICWGVLCFINGIIFISCFCSSSWCSTFPSSEVREAEQIGEVVMEVHPTSQELHATMILK